SVTGNNTISFTDNGQAPGSNKYYFVEVIQPDGDRIISSPIWYRLSQFASVNELEKSFNIVAFPNPVNAMLYVSTDLNEGFEIEITDVSGKIIYSERSSLPQTKLSTADFAAGFYNLKITSGKVVKNQKLVIE
ncbi:MAG TPA: T9SS type A sorting domain-containing protein, partial [Bacteroidia bacterium]|nr:T9SS type A sorting domain-containing protein [Bacteroidia bacterium]